MEGHDALLAERQNRQNWNFKVRLRRIILSPSGDFAPLGEYLLKAKNSLRDLSETGNLDSAFMFRRSSLISGFFSLALEPKLDTFCDLRLVSAKHLPEPCAFLQVPSDGVHDGHAALLEDHIPAGKLAVNLG